jgi:hypothetical protein
MERDTIARIRAELSKVAAHRIGDDAPDTGMTLSG